MDRKCNRHRECRMDYGHAGECCFVISCGLFDDLRAAQSKLHEEELRVRDVCEQRDAACFERNDLRSQLDSAMRELQDATLQVVEQGRRLDAALAWLGVVRDRLPDADVESLQRALGVAKEHEYCPACRSNDVILYHPPLYPKKFYHCRACSAEWDFPVETPKIKPEPDRSSVCQCGNHWCPGCHRPRLSVERLDTNSDESVGMYAKRILPTKDRLDEP